MTRTFFRTSSFAAAFSLGFALFATLGGCSAVVGVKGGTYDGKETDSASKIRTTAQCIQYCNAAMENCTGEFAIYQSRAACLNVCNALPSDDTSGEPSKNTVQCRLDRAKSAKDFPAEACAPAGPGGNGECGTNCESWCILLEEACPDDFEALANCEGACAAIAAAPGFDLASGYEADANNIQCRLSHLGAALGGPAEAKLHCPHVGFTTEGACTGGATDELSPEGYCQKVMGACTDTFAQYKDFDECAAIAFAFELGVAGDTEGNTLACRIYHAGNAIRVEGAAEAHCPHAGPAGDGHCGSAAEGNCQSYCEVFESGCQTAFSAAFTSPTDCLAQCKASGLSGIMGDSGYTYSSSIADDSIQCRIRRAIEAKAAGSEDLCAKAAIVAAPGDPKPVCD